MKIGQHLRRIGYFIVSVGLLGSLLGGEEVDAATYYVATTGNDANAGTESKPFRTLKKGASLLKPGDTLYVKSGTYAEALDNTIPGGTSWSSPVTVAAAPGQTVTIRPPTGSVSVLRFSHATRKYIVVDGFILDGTNVGASAVIISYSSSGGTSHHIRIKNSEIKNAQINRKNPSQKHYGDGVNVTTGSDYNEFINLKVHDNGATDLDHGIYLASSYNLVENSQFYRNAGQGIHAYASGKTGVVNKNIIRNNKIYDNARVGDRGRGIVVSSGSGNLVYNNLIWGNEGGIVVDYNGVSKTEVYNNTVYDNDEFGIAVGSKSKEASVRNNIVYGNGGPAVDNKGSGTTLSNNLVNVDPKFMNAAAKDFRVKAGSPAINKGVTLSKVPKDYISVPRPQGGSYDIGGYEYTGSTSSALATPPMNLQLMGSQ